MTDSTFNALHSLCSPGNYGRIAHGANISKSHVSRVLRSLCGMSDECGERLAGYVGTDTHTLRVYIRERARRRGVILDGAVNGSVQNA